MTNPCPKSRQCRNPSDTQGGHRLDLKTRWRQIVWGNLHCLDRDHQHPRWEAEHCFSLFDHVNAQRIMVLHTPPLGGELDRDDGGHKGCQVVNELINTWRPVLAVCGHAHDAAGHESAGDTLTVNPGALKSGQYAVVDIEERQVSLSDL